MEIVLGIIVVVVLGFVLLKPNLTEKVKDWLISKFK